MTEKLSTLLAFDQALFGGWQYKKHSLQRAVGGGRVVRGIAPYSDCISYQGGSRKLHQLNADNDRFAQGVVITGNDTGDGSNSLTNSGIKVMLAYAPRKDMDGRTFRKLLVDERGIDGIAKIASFQDPLPLDAGLSGEEPLLASLYPTVVLSERNPTVYGMLVSAEPGVFSKKRDTIEVKVGPGGAGAITLPDIEGPVREHVERKVRTAIREHAEFKAKTGTYRIAIAYTTVPIVASRINGYRPWHCNVHPVNSNPLEKVAAKLGGPEGIEDPIALEIVRAVEEDQEAIRQGEEPRRFAELAGLLEDWGIGADPFFQEATIFFPGDHTGGWGTGLLEVTTEKRNPFGGEPTREQEDMCYTPASRARSIALTERNPYTGMCEVQIDLGATNLAANVLSFTPDAAQEARDAAAEERRSFVRRSEGGGFSELGVIKTAGASNVGTTDFITWRQKKGATKTGHVDNLGPLTAFRWVLTNKRT